MYRRNEIFYFQLKIKLEKRHFDKIEEAGIVTSFVRAPLTHQCMKIISKAT